MVVLLQGRSNYEWAREAAKWGADFLARGVESTRILIHIGDIQRDHAYLGRAEAYPQINRNIRFATSGTATGI
jgi:FixJ family two-component response regulator